ncbi:MAG: L,D-transpeptidase family protein [Micavibrio aeruginosavorus]|nr:L,D-transpeptidase family protein [Micavibrio aeruginosavorus]
MPSIRFFRLTKLLLITAVTASTGFGLTAHAVAEKSGSAISGPVSADFFSFNLGGRGVLLASLSSWLQQGRIDTLAFMDADALRDFYAAREGRTLWIDTWGSDHERVEEILPVLEQSWRHGLNPDTYHVREITALRHAKLPTEKAQLELLASDGVARYVHDLTGFRLPPAAIRQEAGFWRKPMEARPVLDTIADRDDPAGILKSFAPRDALYARLQEELVALSENPDRAYERFLPISFGGALLHPGEFNKGVANLRGRLGLKHDPAYGPESKYDDQLAAAVMNFQRENGLEADGIIGSKTLALLNTGVEDKIEQIIVNLERLRWIEEEKPEKYVLVNIPSATLWAVEDGNVAFEMPVIVGRPERPTKSFITEITGVRFNPKWTVPPTIKAKDFLPKLIEDPAYLANKGIDVYQIVDGQRITLDSTAIDWTTVTREDLKSLRMVQAAGDNNALGRIRVLMDNPFDIYLHDTNAPEYFKKPSRAASSGCIRLSEPEKIADFILHDNDGWSEARRNALIDSGKTSEVTAAEKIPVFILYQTIWQDNEGRLVYPSQF